MAKNNLTSLAIQEFHKWCSENAHDNSDEPLFRVFLAGFIACAKLRPTSREADDLPPFCLCPKDGMPSAFCPIHGAVATGHGLR